MNFEQEKSSKKYKEKTIINIGGEKIGDGFTVIAGPCACESYESLLDEVKFLSSRGIKFIRAGAFKPRTSPYSFQGLGREALEYFKEIKKDYDVKFVSELMDLRELDYFMDAVDIIQVGARNMQNFSLLTELGKINKPVLLKRGFANKIKEFIAAAEYILKGGNEDVILCERGIRTFETATRNTLDISSVPIIKKYTNLPIIVDPSHAGGLDYLVKPLSLASAAVGADGIMVEVNDKKTEALSDGEQAINYAEFEDLLQDLKKILKAMDKTYE